MSHGHNDGSGQSLLDACNRNSTAGSLPDSPHGQADHMTSTPPLLPLDDDAACLPAKMPPTSVSSENIATEQANLMKAWSEAAFDCATLLLYWTLGLMVTCWSGRNCASKSNRFTVCDKKLSLAHLASCPTGGNMRWHLISHNMSVSLLIVGMLLPLVNCEIPAVTTTNLAGFGTATWPDGVAGSPGSINENRLESLLVKQQPLEAEKLEAPRDSGKYRFQDS